MVLILILPVRCLLAYSASAGILAILQSLNLSQFLMLTSFNYKGGLGVNLKLISNLLRLLLGSFRRKYVCTDFCSLEIMATDKKCASLGAIAIFVFTINS